MGDQSPKEVFSMAEVAKHNSADSCWLVIDGEVYDVTSFLQEHPGGKRVLLKEGGKVYSHNCQPFSFLPISVSTFNFSIDFQCSPGCYQGLSPAALQRSTCTIRP